jgi:hypothetical protein
MLAERMGDRAKAIERYEGVLAARPSQSLAAARLAGLRGSPPTSGRVADGRSIDVDTEGRRWSTVVTSRHGVYDALLRDGSEMSSQAIRLMDSLEFDVRARPSAFAGRLLVASIAGGFLIAVGIGLVRSIPAQPILILVGVAVIGMTYLGIWNRSYTLRRGRLQTSSGLPSRQISNLELWRVADMWLKASTLNRLTNDGTIEFELHNIKRHVKVTGLAKGDDLGLIYQDLLNLVFVLRSQQAVKGIIY